MPEEQKPKRRAGMPETSDNRRTVEDLDKAIGILCTGLQAAEAEKDKTVCASMAMALSWAIGWKKQGREFQKMLDACMAMDARRSGGQRHRTAHGRKR